MSGAVAPQAAEAPEFVSRICQLEVIFANGDRDWGQPLHAGTFSELGPDGHPAVPVDAFLADPAAVRPGSRP